MKNHLKTIPNFLILVMEDVVALEKNTKVLAAGRSGKKDDCGERKRTETEVTAGRKNNMCACKKMCTREATTGRKNNTRAWEEDLTSVGLGFL
jgi:hypothetical protein